MSGGVVAAWLLAENVYGAASQLFFVAPFVVVAVGIMAFAAWRGGASEAAFALAPLVIDIVLIIVLPFPFGIVAIFALIPVVATLQNFARLRGVCRSSLAVTDWPVLIEKAEAVLNEFTAYGFVPVGAAVWNLRRPPVTSLLLVNPAASTYADVTWHPRAGVVMFTVVSELRHGGMLITGRTGRFETPPHQLRQVLPDHVASQLVWFHLSALEFLASHGITVEPATFERTVPRWFEAFEADQQQIAQNGFAMAWGAAWRGILRRVLDRGPLWTHPDIEQKLAAFAAATDAPSERHARQPWSPPTDASGGTWPFDLPGAPPR
jgi:hypothetical protein